MPRNGSGGYTPPLNSWNPPINGAAAQPADWQAILSDLATAIQASIAADGQTPITGVLNFSNNRISGVGAPIGQGDALRWQQLTKGANIASAATIDIPNEGNLFEITGTSNISGINTTYPGRSVFLVFEDELELTHSASFSMPTGANIKTSAGDVAVFINEDTGIWRCVYYPNAFEGAVFESFPIFYKEVDAPCIKKTSASAASIAAGTAVRVQGGYKVFPSDTAITMPALTAGADYSVWVLEDGTAQAVLDMFSSPASAPSANAVKIGGFHYGLVASGTTPASGGFSTTGITSGGGSFGWTQADVDKIAGINEFSIWDLTWRCKGEQRGMTFDPIKQAWVGIYFMSDSPHIHGPSAYNTNVASGTVLPYIPAKWGGNGVLKYSRLSAFEAHELASAFGLRLPTFEEFMSFAFGVTEAQSLGGAAVTIAATARQPGYTSRIGLEQATGHQYIIGAPIHSSNGTAWAAAGRGDWYGTTGLALFGGFRDNAAYSGSRCASFLNALSYSDWFISVRAAGDHLNLGRAAR